MRAALAILWDSFRLLQARKLFWFALGISVLVALFYASIGFNAKGMTLFFGAKTMENPLLQEGKPEAAAFYVMIFTDVIVKLWLAWVAVVLALLSTASIFPDFISEGSIGIALSKPVGRLRLFLLKYFGGLMFVALQVTVFTTIVFVALGMRVGEWNLTVFWAVPVITFVFSLLYCMAVWIGIWTRSTLFALLGAFMMWGTALLVQWGEEGLYEISHFNPEAGVTVDFRSGTRSEGESREKDPEMVAMHRNIERAVLPLPKTRDATNYLKRLVRMKERDSLLSGVTLDDLLKGELPDPKKAAAMKRLENRHSAAYVFGTSALFEVVILSLAAWIFCRRDY
ncbi:ABC transporter permease [Luteolibacter marinus]|uniref:ABC transporter permease n=1 Tax=Luteolibacter marinus TaxID=2776705 RepID=UPI0018662AB4|nr:hypothetical protein [Luteolibacter marinus]